MRFAHPENHELENPPKIFVPDNLYICVTFINSRSSCGYNLLLTIHPSRIHIHLHDVPYEFCCSRICRVYVCTRHGIYIYTVAWRTCEHSRGRGHRRYIGFIVHITYVSYSHDSSTINLRVRDAHLLWEKRSDHIFLRLARVINESETLSIYNKIKEFRSMCVV